MRIYIAGPMTFINEGNYPAFFAKAEELRALGHEVENPAENDGDTLEEALANRGNRFDLETDYMRLDLVRIAKCDGMYFLDGFSASKGAALEGRIAGYLELERWHENMGDLPAPVPPILIGLSGYARSGKDTVGKMLSENYGFERIAFADKVRDFVHASSPFVRGAVSAHGWEEAKENPSVRAALQRCGMAARETFGGDVWIDTAFANLKPGGRYVVTDVRFPNEVKRIEDMGGMLIRVVRPGYGPVNGHASETAIDDSWAHLLIHNDEALIDLEEEVDRLMSNQGVSMVDTAHNRETYTAVKMTAPQVIPPAFVGEFVSGVAHIDNHLGVGNPHE